MSASDSCECCHAPESSQSVSETLPVPPEPPATDNNPPLFAGENNTAGCCEAEAQSDVIVDISNTSDVLVKTHFRVQNLCCAKESRLISRLLAPYVADKRVQDLRTDEIGNSVTITHWRERCPSSDIVNLLNQHNLGVSISQKLQAKEHVPETLSKQLRNMLSPTFSFILFVLLLVSVAIDLGYFSIGPENYFGIAIVAVGIWEFVLGAYYSLKSCRLDMTVLMLTACIGAIALFEWTEAAGVIVLFRLSKTFTAYCLKKVSQAVENVKAVTLPKQGFVMATQQWTDLSEIAVNDVVVVRAGELLPVDGVVVKGTASIDESALTGESFFLNKSTGDEVMGGTICQDGFLHIRTTALAEDSTVAKISNLLDDITREKTELDTLIDTFAQYYTPAVISAAIVVVLVGFRATGDFDKWLTRGLAMLLLACPCALIMASPVPTICCIAAAYKKGVLIKSASVLEKLSFVTMVAMDKTGTVTKGKFSVASVKFATNTQNTEEMRQKYMKYAASLENQSVHPIAVSVVNYVTGCIADALSKHGTQAGLHDVEEFTIIPGLGIEGVIREGNQCYDVCVGNEDILQAKQISSLDASLSSFAQMHDEKRNIVLYVVVNNTVELLVALSDSIREEAFPMVRSLHGNQCKTLLLSGDRSLISAHVAERLGIQSFYGQLKPVDKSDIIADFQTGALEKRRWSERRSCVETSGCVGGDGERSDVGGEFSGRGADEQ